MSYFDAHGNVKQVGTQVTTKMRANRLYLGLSLIVPSNQLALAGEERPRVALRITQIIEEQRTIPPSSKVIFKQIVKVEDGRSFEFDAKEEVEVLGKPVRLMEVDVTAQIWVLATDAREAEEIAEQNLREIDHFAFSGYEFKYRPSGSDLQSLPYVSDDGYADAVEFDADQELTIEQLIELGAAPYMKAE